MGNPEVSVGHENQEPADQQAASDVMRLREKTSKFLEDLGKNPWVDRAGHCPSPFPRTRDDFDE